MNILIDNLPENRKDIRKYVITKFLDEEPGTGKGEYCSKYVYEVETLQNGDKVLLKRPAVLNKGVDFEVHMEGIEFNHRAKKNMPSHEKIINDLFDKKNENSIEYDKVSTLINRIYNCQNINELDYHSISFNSGYPIEAILKAIKWLFIEQDVTYWNWSGRNMLYLKLNENNLC